MDSGIYIIRNSDNHVGSRGYKHTEESIRKMSKSHKGKKLSEEQKLKIGLSVAATKRLRALKRVPEQTTRT